MGSGVANLCPSVSRDTIRLVMNHWGSKANWKCRAKAGKIRVSMDRIEKSIFLIRGQKVILDKDLAELYGVRKKQLKRAVRRNINRFPTDFMFELTVSYRRFFVATPPWRDYHFKKHETIS
jgi:hypothetical protein